MNLLVFLITTIHAYYISASRTVTSLAKVEIPTPDQIASANYGFDGQSAYTLTGAIILLITGTFLVFYGYGSFKGLMFVTGAYLFSLLTVAVLNTLQARQITNFESQKDLIYFSIMIPVAILGGFLFWWLWKVGIFCLGGLFGFLLATSLLQFQALSNIFNQDLYRYLFILAFALVLGILALYIQKYLIIISSAFIGSFAMFMGIDYFVQSGFGVWFHRAFSAGNFDGFDGRGYGMVAGFVLVAIFGAALQLSHADRDGK